MWTWVLQSGGMESRRRDFQVGVPNVCKPSPWFIPRTHKCSTPWYHHFVVRYTWNTLKVPPSRARRIGRGPNSSNLKASTSLNTFIPPTRATSSHHSHQVFKSFSFGDNITHWQFRSKQRAIGGLQKFHTMTWLLGSGCTLRPKRELIDWRAGPQFRTSTSSWNQRESHRLFSYPTSCFLQWTSSKRRVKSEVQLLSPEFEPKWAYEVGRGQIGQTPWLHVWPLNYVPSWLSMMSHKYIHLVNRNPNSLLLVIC